MHSPHSTQVVAIPLEQRVRLEVDLYVKIAGRAAIDTRFAFAGKAYAIAFVHAGRNLD